MIVTGQTRPKTSIFGSASAKCEISKLVILTPRSDRSFYVHLYQPQRWHEGKTAVVVVSHGLASRPENFTPVSKQLASFGYLKALRLW